MGWGDNNSYISQIVSDDLRPSLPLVNRPSMRPSNLLRLYRNDVKHRQFQQMRALLNCLVALKE